MIYCYKLKNGEVIERCFPIGTAPQSIKVFGKKAKRDWAAEQARFHNTPGNWPKESCAMGVHPSQVAEEGKFLKEQGIPTEFNEKTGNPIVRNRRHRNQLMKLYGLRDNDAGYGDYAGSN